MTTAVFHVMPRNERLTKADAVTFLLTHIVVEKNCVFEMNPANLFQIMSMAAAAVERVHEQDDAIPHEIMEAIASEFINHLNAGSGSRH